MNHVSLFPAQARPGRFARCTSSMLLATALVAVAALGACGGGNNGSPAPFIPAGGAAPAPAPAPAPVPDPAAKPELRCAP